jgi:hypothetical protein
MEESTRQEILALGSSAHRLTERSYQQDPSTPGDPGWRDKQRILLADMALHLLQTAMKAGELSAEDLQRNLYSILTIADPFLPGARLKAVADGLYAEPAPEGAPE